jgi:hypothetical protein
MLSSTETKVRRSPGKQFMMLLRRGHLYLGLFLFPWAVLYGVTAFLFNHPTAFSDAAATNFATSEIQGTSLETLPKPQSIAEAVVAKLNETQKPDTPYVLAGEAKFNRDFAFGTVKTETGALSFLVDPRTGGGTIRTAPPSRPTPEPAPFAVGKSQAPREGKGNRRPAGSQGPAQDGILLETPVHECILTAMPTVLNRAGFPTGEVVVTSVPEVTFPIQSQDRRWLATYNPMTGAVSGVAEGKIENDLSWRRFLLRLHTAHGYPGETNSRWFWAIIVDVMAFTMCFWGLSGLVMWWQLKATRRLGAVILTLSAISALTLGYAMHTAMTQ